MSQSRDNISMEELVRGADLIVLVKKADPFISRKKKRTSWLPWKPPFEIFYYHYIIEKTIYDNQRVPSARRSLTRLKVRMADYHGGLRVHKLYYNKGIRKIPIYRRYISGINPRDTDTYITFCYYDTEDGVFQFVAENAFESVEKIEMILTLTEALKQSSDR